MRRGYQQEKVPARPSALTLALLLGFWSGFDFVRLAFFAEGNPHVALELLVVFDFLGISLQAAPFTEHAAASLHHCHLFASDFR
jgi:hypothetical protein